LRVFVTKAFARFARRALLGDRELCSAIEGAEAGQVDADLGGEVIKLRIARAGGGKSGGYRTIVLFRRSDRAFFVFGFVKRTDRTSTSTNCEVSAPWQRGCWRSRSRSWPRPWLPKRSRS